MIPSATRKMNANIIIYHENIPRLNVTETYKFLGVDFSRAIKETPRSLFIEIKKPIHG